MATYEEAYLKFANDMGNLGYLHHEELYHAIMKHLGPSVHDNDASKVACTDDSERKTIKEKFLIGKLGLEDSEELDKAIEQVCHAMGDSNRSKSRPTFYYLLTAIFNKEYVFLGESARRPEVVPQEEENTGGEVGNG